jgi:sRNA-binding regulator protein Hfq
MVLERVQKQLLHIFTASGVRFLGKLNSHSDFMVLFLSDMRVPASELCQFQLPQT